MRAVRRWNKAAATAIGLAAGIVIVGSLGGCYTRVVSARGFGADQYGSRARPLFLIAWS